MSVGMMARVGRSCRYFHTMRDRCCLGKMLIGMCGVGIQASQHSGPTYRSTSSSSRSCSKSCDIASRNWTRCWSGRGWMTAMQVGINKVKSIIWGVY